MEELEISYALNKQVPDMRSRGFVIGTSYGEMSVPPGPLAEQLADTVRLVLALELARLRAAPVHKTVSYVAGPDWFDAQLMGGCKAMSATYTSAYDFAAERLKFLAIADALRSSSSPLEFRARLLASVQQSWHSYDLLAITNVVATIGEGLSDLIGEDLDFDGLPV